MFVFSMDGLRVVRLEDILHQVDILITATGTYTAACTLVSSQNCIFWFVNSVCIELFRVHYIHYTTCRLYLLVVNE